MKKAFQVFNVIADIPLGHPTVSSL